MGHSKHNLLHFVLCQLSCLAKVSLSWLTLDVRGGTVMHCGSLNSGYGPSEVTQKHLFPLWKLFAWWNTLHFGSNSHLSGSRADLFGRNSAASSSFPVASALRGLRLDQRKKVQLGACQDERWNFQGWDLSVTSESSERKVSEHFGTFYWFYSTNVQVSPGRLCRLSVHTVNLQSNTCSQPNPETLKKKKKKKTMRGHSIHN